MRSRTANWFETRVRYDKMMEDGQNKKTTETYVVDAYTFGEAEEAITKEMGAYINGEFEVKAITPATYGEIFFSDADGDDKWFKCKLAFITLDDKTQKEKRTSVYYLVQAASVSGAVKHVDEVMGSTMIDYEITAPRPRNKTRRRSRSTRSSRLVPIFQYSNIPIGPVFQLFQYSSYSSFQ